MPNTSPVIVCSWEELQQHITTIVRRLNHEPALALAAAANPFLALEEIGYLVPADARPPLEDRLRFSRDDVALRRQLRERVFAAAGTAFDLSSAAAVREVLHDRLKLRPYPNARGCARPFPDTRPPVRRSDAAEDPLSVLSGKHPIIEPLLAYRKLEASRPRFASVERYEAIRRGERAVGVSELHIRFKREGDAAADDKTDKPPRPPRNRSSSTRRRS